MIRRGRSGGADLACASNGLYLLTERTTEQGGRPMRTLVLTALIGVAAASTTGSIQSPMRNHVQ